ncbi:hypothetical protein HF086_011615 [Spodoptera exigua]|uniref:Uncharacterized protein n=1 Tax=Spodoptera exigua TaxID=7107 RepID=A0A922MT92_SPOEX|nr:hypothetical protein HF086_011615 [Spodoptera exigua]
MSRQYFFVSLCIILACAVSITAEDDNDVEEEEDREARCFQFTWLGPRWNNNSVFLNATCQDATRMSEGVPCAEPLVVSFDNSTYMCTRAVDTNGQAITRGCYEQRNGSFVTRACFCRSIPGGVPCNNAFITNISTFFVFLVAILIVFKSDLIK